ncbi:hypothetical protein [Massilia genomosp. 1]|uniref:Uncharacterized protein n=1 Tax=Massilia genomosp. 1 TaxID=2609280 RepID=A0ABX0MRV3_9BURK|nr:hypothetical protein [Massilia genomosp. 1]NHZ62675.1 hypothetical protein [Massilia genomosp. 1]
MKPEIKELKLENFGETVSSIFRSLTEKEWNLIDTCAQSEFSFWQFERLLNSAADLLDRANDDRASLLGLLATDFEMRLQFDSVNLHIENEERRYKISGDPMQAPIAYAALNAERNRLIKRDADQIIAQFKAQIENWRLFADTADPVRKWQGTADQAGATAALQQFKVSIENSAREAEAAIEELMRGVEETKLARVQHNARKHVLTNGDILDPRHETEIIAGRMMMDFNSALSRISAAQKGLSQLLGRGVIRHRLGAADSALDSVAIAQNYVRELIHWHALKTQHDQSFTHVVHLRDSCTNDQWNYFINGNGKIEFLITRKELNLWSLPRLRGISAYFEGKQTRSVALLVKAPQQATRSDGELIVQADVPPCWLGRVNNANSSREPESNGAITLMNVCPIHADGYSWVAEMPKPMLAETRQIENIVVEFNCVGVPISKISDWAPEAFQQLDS